MGTEVRLLRPHFAPPYFRETVFGSARRGAFSLSGSTPHWSSVHNRWLHFSHHCSKSGNKFVQYGATSLQVGHSTSREGAMSMSGDISYHKCYSGER